MIFGMSKVCFMLLPTFCLKLTFICYYIPHEYVLLALTVDAVFSYLLLTNGCTVKKNNEKKSFANLPYLFIRS